MSKNAKLFLILATGPLIGGLLFLLTPKGEPGDSAVADAPQEEVEDRGLTRLQDPDSLPNEAAIEFLEDRWGHMGDPGTVSPKLDALGEIYFVEPRVFVARQGKKRFYATAIAKPERFTGEGKLTGGERRMANLDRMSDEMRQIRIPEGAARTRPIDNPDDMPDKLKGEHPLSPDYKGPTGG